MSERTPTLDNLLLGVVAGACVGGPSLLIAWCVHEQTIPDPAFLGWGSLAAISLLFLYLPVVFMPAWSVAHLVGLRNSAGSVVAGVTSFVAPWMLLSGFFGGELGVFVGWLAHLVVPGALMGFVIWRVSHWTIDAQ